MNATKWLVVLLTLVTVHHGDAAEPWPNGPVIDLTHNFNSHTIYWPTEKDFRHHTEFAGINDKGYYYSAYELTTAEHGGTHLDAPVHFAEGALTTDEIPLTQLIGNAIVIDVSAKTAKNRDYQILPADLKKWESVHGPIPEDVILLFRTGWSEFWPDRLAYLGTAERGPTTVTKLHFPGIHPDTATTLAQQYQIKAVGIDTASIDYGQSTEFLSHRILYAQNIPGFENVTHLDRLPAKGARVIALPMKIEGGSGGPLRIIALLGQ